MTLVDTSVWIEFFRGAARARGLAQHLADNRLLLHPWVLGELALGSLGPRRDEVLSDLRRLPRARVLPDDEVLEQVEKWSLAGCGIGWVDAHLIASADAHRATLWTVDGRLARAAARAGVASQ